MLDSSTFNFVELALLIAFLVSFLILIYHWVFYYGQLIMYNPAHRDTDQSVSLIVAFKDESKNLGHLIKRLLAQNYGEFEIVLVNDHSQDDYESVIPKADQIRLIHLEKGKSGKKQAINAGISASKYDYLLFIDADCMPNSDAWISHMAGALNNSKEIVLGYSKFKAKKGLLNRLIRYETFANGVQYLSFAIKGRAYMGVGRNMAFKKELIVKYQDSKHLNIRSGDDDLRVNQLATKTNASVAIGPNSLTLSEAKTSFIDYLYQRRRQLEAGNYYKTSDRIHLAIIGVSQLYFSIGFIYSFFDVQFFRSIAILLLIKFGIQYFVSFFLCKKFSEKELWLLLPLLEVVYIFLICLIGISTWVWKVDRWK